MIKYFCDVCSTNIGKDTPTNYNTRNVRTDVYYGFECFQFKAVRVRVLGIYIDGVTNSHICNNCQAKALRELADKVQAGDR